MGTRLGDTAVSMPGTEVHGADGFALDHQVRGGVSSAGARLGDTAVSMPGTEVHGADGFALNDQVRSGVSSAEGIVPVRGSARW